MSALDPVVEFFIEDTWTDVSQYVYYSPALVIRNGIAAEGQTADPSSCEFTLNNTDGRFTPRNSAGAYYPWIKRNMPIRVSVDSEVRFFGYLTEFPIEWNHNESVATVRVTANGISRRLARSNEEPSTLRSTFLTLSAGGEITGYWPIEDLPGATQIAPAQASETPGVVNATPVFAAVDPGVMSKPVPTWDGASATFTPRVGTNNGQFTAGVLITFPATGELTGGEELVRIETAGTARSWRMLYSPTDGGKILLQVLNNLGVELIAHPTLVANLDGTTQFLKLEVDNDGADVDWFLDSYPGAADTNTVTGAQVTQPTSASIGAGVIAIGAEVGIGHLILADTNDALFTLSLDQALVGYAGETIAQRFSRLQDQTGVDLSWTTGEAEYADLGPQPDGSLLEILRDAEKANTGAILYDRHTDGAFAIITRSARYNDLGPLLTLDYAAGHLSPPLLPTDDDQQLRNDVTITRASGSSAREVLEAGALSTQDYPDGAGLYPFADTLNVYLDTQLPYIAQWILALGTEDVARWPQVTIDLVRNPSLVSAWDDMRPGGRVVIENLPTLSGVADVNLQMIGWTEVISTTHRLVTMNCVPGDVWLNVLQLDDLVFGELDVMHLAL